MGWFITHFVMWQGREWAWGWGYCWARSPSLPQSYILLIGLAEDKHDLSVTVHDCSHKKNPRTLGSPAFILGLHGKECAMGLKITPGVILQMRVYQPLCALPDLSLQLSCRYLSLMA